MALKALSFWKILVSGIQNQMGKMIFDCENVVCGQVESLIKSLNMIFSPVTRKSKMLRLVNLMFIYSMAPSDS